MKGIFSSGGTKNFSDGNYGFEILLYCSYHGRDFAKISKQYLTLAQANEQSKAIHKAVDEGRAKEFFKVTECALCKPFCNSCENLYKEKTRLKNKWK